MSELGGRLGWALVGALLWYALAPGAELVDDPRPVFVERTHIVEQEPDTVVRFIDRIVYVTAPMVRHEIALGGAALEVAEFCRPSVTRSVSGDSTQSVSPPAPQLLIRSVVFREPGLFRPLERARAQFTGVTSHGDLELQEYLVRGSFEARAGPGTDITVRYGRVALLRDVFEGGSQLWAVFSIGRELWGAFK